MPVSNAQRVSLLEAAARIDIGCDNQMLTVGHVPQLEVLLHAIGLHITAGTQHLWIRYVGQTSGKLEVRMAQAATEEQTFFGHFISLLAPGHKLKVYTLDRKCLKEMQLISQLDMFLLRQARSTTVPGMIFRALSVCSFWSSPRCLSTRLVVVSTIAFGQDSPGRHPSASL